MGKIPKKLNDELNTDPFYSRCCMSREKAPYTKIERHHNFIFAGRQISEKWCILPIAKFVHDIANKKEIKEQLDWIMLNRADDETLRKYSKAIDLLAKRDRLNKKYGKLFSNS